MAKLTENEFKNLSELKKIEALKRDGSLIRFIESPSVVEQEIATASIKNLKWIKNPAKHILMKYVSFRYSIKDMELSDELKLFAIATVPSSFEHIKLPTDEMKMIALSKDGTLIRYIKEPTEDMKQLALSSCPYAIEYIKDPTEDMINQAIEHDPDLIELVKNPSLECQLKAVNYNGMNLEFIKDIANEEVKLAAVKNDGDAIKFIDDPSEKIILAAAKNSSSNGEVSKMIQTGKITDPKIIKKITKIMPRTVMLVENPTDELWHIALKKEPYLIKLKKNPSEKMKKIAIKASYPVIKYLKQTDDLQIYAMSVNTEAYRYLKNPCLQAKLMRD